MVIGGLAVQPAGQSTPQERRHVFVPAEATIEPLARAVPGGNAVLRVRFAEGSRPPDRVTYQTESGTVVLADDGKGFDTKSGDGLYTALGNMDLVAARARIERLGRSTHRHADAYLAASIEDRREGCHGPAAVARRPGVPLGDVGDPARSIRRVRSWSATSASSRMQAAPRRRATSRRWASGASAT